MRLSSLQIRDPFLFTDHSESRYVLFGTTDTDAWSPAGTGFDHYVSIDLATWSGPTAALHPLSGARERTQYWAPEVHAYRGAHYMLATLGREGSRRGTHIFVADGVTGVFQPWSNGPITPADWDCLDGTLHVDDDGAPWIVYCHEWVQVEDGAIVAQRLADDLRRTLGEPTVLFTASSARWVRPVSHETLGAGRPGFVTDGPFLHRLSSGELIMLWSSFGDGGYSIGIARSLSGTVLGPWAQSEAPLDIPDAGHAMIGTSLDGQLLLVYHQPNRTPWERPIIREVSELAGAVLLLPPTS